MSTDGVTPYNSGPLVFYPAQTVVLDALDRPIAPHTALTTQDGALVPSTAPQVSTVTTLRTAASTLNALFLHTTSLTATEGTLTNTTTHVGFMNSALVGSAVHLQAAQFASSATVSSLAIQGNVSFSLYLGSTITTDYLNLGTALYGAPSSLMRTTDLLHHTTASYLVVSPLLSTTALTASTLATTSLATSSLAAIQATAQTALTQDLAFQKANGATLTLPTLQVTSTLYAQTTTTSSILYHTLTPEPTTMWTAYAQVSTLSTVLAAYTGALLFSSLVISTVQTSTLSASTAVFSTLTAAPIVTASTLQTSTLATGNTQVSALQTSTVTGASTAMHSIQSLTTSSLRLSTLRASTAQTTIASVSTLTTQTLAGSLTGAWEGSTLTASSVSVIALTISSLATQSLYGSTLQTQTASTSRLTVSTLTTQTLRVPSVTVTTTTTLPILTASTLQLNALQTQTINNTPFYVGLLATVSTMVGIGAATSTAQFSVQVGSAATTATGTTAIGCSTIAAYGTGLRATNTGISSLLLQANGTGATNEIAIGCAGQGVNTVALPRVVVPAGSIIVNTNTSISTNSTTNTRSLLVNGTVSAASLHLQGPFSLQNDSSPLLYSVDTVASLQNPAGPLRLITTDGITLTSPQAETYMGILQSNPITTLDVTGPITAQGIHAWSARAQAGVSLSFDGAGILRSAGAQPSKLIFQTRGGNVGIGSVAPTATLDVAGAGRLESLLVSTVTATSFQLSSAPFVSSPWFNPIGSILTPSMPTVSVSTITAVYQNLPAATSTSQGAVLLGTGLSASGSAYGLIALPHFSGVGTGLNGNVYTYMAHSALQISSTDGYLTVDRGGYYRVTIEPAANDTVTLLSPRDAYSTTTSLTVILLLLDAEPIWAESLQGQVGGAITVQLLSI